MDALKILGRRKVDFMGTNGQQVTGVTLYVGEEDQYTEGMKTDKIFVGTSKSCYNNCCTYPIGSVIFVSYNRNGSIVDVTLKVTNDK